MSSWVSRLAPFIFLLSIIALYQLSFMPVSWALFKTISILFIFGMLAITAVKFTVRRTSAIDLLNALLSTVIGFGTAAFFLFCSERLFHEISYSDETTSIIHFLLPFFLTVVSFHCLRAIPFFNSTDDSSQNGARSALSAIRKFIPDQSALEDGRIVDLARTGLFDGQIIVPTFLPSELKLQSEVGDEPSRARAKKALDAIRRLESMAHICIQSKEIALPDSYELCDKIIHSAKLLNASLITNESPSCKTEVEQEMYLAVDTIANALRPPIPKGEFLSIKIQRLGKEPKQGIGYLEDGTMVVVNGGGDYLGRTVRTQVLSQKYSSSGKIVFCNVREDDGEDRPGLAPYSCSETNYSSSSPYAQSL